MSSYDVAIVGSGLGGLVCGYILSKNGYKVAVFEKNKQIGGCLQTFKRFGMKFETGMHYIGSLDDGQVLNKFFKYLSLMNDVKLSRLDPNGYDIISIDGKEYKFASGYENFTNTLSEHFPEEKSNIEMYIDKIKFIANSSPLYKVKAISNTILDANIIKMSVSDFIKSITKNKLLQNVLIGNIPLYAGVEDKTPLYIHALITDFYINSAFRIIGGSDCIANSLAKSIKQMGGDIFNNSFVKSINCDNERATSIELQGSRLFDVNYVISNIHPEATLEKLNTPLIRNVYRDRIRNIDNTISNFTVYIKFKPKMIKYCNYNFYHYNCSNIWDCENYTSEDWPRNYFFMHQCCEEDQQYAAGAELIAYMNYKDVEEWKGTKIGHRGEKYETFKKIMAEKLISNLNNQFPGIVNAIEAYETSTPLTYEDYTATKNGSMYGILRDKNNSIHTFCSQRTKVPNLFLTGQNINSHGILGVIIGSIVTCAEIVGMNNIIEQINNYDKI